MTARLALQPGATDALMNVALSLPVRPPDDYLAFMRKSNGAEGAVGATGYLQLWPLDQLATWNEAYAVDEFASGIVLFGSDGGNEAYAFVQDDDRVRIVGVPLIGMSWNDAVVLGESFREFLIAIAAPWYPWY